MNSRKGGLAFPNQGGMGRDFFYRYGRDESEKGTKEGVEIQLIPINGVDWVIFQYLHEKFNIWVISRAFGAGDLHQKAHRTI
uniref:Uncharacterized protein n=1 Tax=Lutzomyia longipalpis TaxID=7200 RepID=A0A1B0CTR8_LUTLO